MEIANIIERCGGTATIASAIGTTPWAVDKWLKNGIPEKHWAALRALDPTLIPDRLHHLNERLRSLGKAA